MKQFLRTIEKIMTLITLGTIGSAALAATPALFSEQSAITGASNTIKAARLPVRNSAGVIKYYDITLKFQLDATGAPVLAPFYPVIGLSPTLTVGTFKAGNYKDSCGNVYSVSGPGAASGGRTTWGILLTKETTNHSCRLDLSLSGSWTTGAIAGHPLEARLKAQGITSTAFSWGTVSAYNGVYITALTNCSYYGYAVGAAQSGNVLSLNGFCSGKALQTGVLTVNLCTSTNPC